MCDLDCDSLVVQLEVLKVTWWLHSDSSRLFRAIHAPLQVGAIAIWLLK